MKLKDINTIAVYGTLKRDRGNFCVMERAKGKFIKESFVEFDKLSGGGFPIAKFKEGTNKFIKVELFEVPEEGVLNSLDRLEGYPTFYDRKEITTTDGDVAIIYEITRDMNDNSDAFKINKPSEDGKQYYNWK